MLLKGLFSLVALIVVMGALILVPAGTLDYWQAWLFLACYFVASLLVSVWLMRKDPALLERRMRGGPFAEGERNQKIIMTITSIGFVGLLVVPGLDRRFGWSHMPDAVAVLGDALLLAGWYGILRVFRANTYAAATIQVASGQTVISTGPYAIVRHPMYAAALLMLLGVPVSLASWWGVLVFAAILPALAWRLIDEERVLVRDLPGYADYRRKVPWRLVPYVW
ncbi:MAG TPA: isoprenylcysteine carboxylmethyltransferase family protein [Sphingomicrobium sp.]|jgi:protein-S-isoprenylcysteine O-methyltransferase Ste14|nr:isoprenylcysteine carboxylmethyltransferase family protein [Sphingomicrobium sp.]